MQAVTFRARVAAPVGLTGFDQRCQTAGVLPLSAA